MTIEKLTKRLERLGWKFVKGEKHIRGEGPSGRIIWIPRMEGNIPVGKLAMIEKETGVKFIS